MCRNGQYTERGIKEIDGFMSERWRIEPEYVMKIDRSLGLLGVLLEPTTVVAKAWEQVVAVGQRAFWEPRIVLVTGAGPIGLLAALVGKQHGLEVHVLDRVESGLKPELVRALGATYHTGTIAARRIRAGRRSSNARAMGESSPNPFGTSARAALCVSRASAPAGRGRMPTADVAARMRY